MHGAYSFGGMSWGEAAKAVGEGLNMLARVRSEDAAQAGILGGHHRRQEDWTLQKDLAAKEMIQIDQQLAASDIRIAIANAEVSNQQLQIDNASQVEYTLRTKYTNGELYSWMISQISATYYQAYKLAGESGEGGYRAINSARKLSSQPAALRLSRNEALPGAFRIRL